MVDVSHFEQHRGRVDSGEYVVHLLPNFGARRKGSRFGEARLQTLGEADAATVKVEDLQLGQQRLDRMLLGVLSDLAEHAPTLDIDRGSIEHVGLDAPLMM